MELANGKGIDDALKLGVDTTIYQGDDARTKIDEICGSAAENSKYPKPLDDVAFQGIAGEIVRAISPHTEGDPVALLLQFLVAFGNVIDRKPQFSISGARHGTNLFLVCVGNTSTGRKGTSWSAIKYLLKMVEEKWSTGRILSGSSSGEGWIWAVRDEIIKNRPQKENGEWVTVEVVEDPGVDDKRLLLVESEFATLLKVISRDGNTLSDIVRKAWDGETLISLTKNAPARATDPHISLIGHITSNELNKHLTETEAANGFGNRILWACVKRSKLLPNGGDLLSVDLSRIVRDLKASIEFATSVERVTKGVEADILWHRVYGELTRDRQGLLGAMCGRAAPMALRLAMVYALLDRQIVIQIHHLQAALAILDYCEDSCRCIFGDSLGDPIADEILNALKQSSNGLSRTEIRDLFARNRNATQVSSALERLRTAGKATASTQQTGGRPSERWFAAQSVSHP